MSIHRHSADGRRRVLIGLLLLPAIFGLAAWIGHALRSDEWTALPQVERAALTPPRTAPAALPHAQPASSPESMAGRPAATGRLVFADAAAASAWAGQHYATRPETGSDLPAALLDTAGIRDLAAQVAGQADYRLALVSDKYGLSPAQQGLAYPIIIRSTPAYRAAVAAGTLTEDEPAADPGVVLEPAAAAEADDDFALALDSSLEALEAELAAVLDPAQVAAMSEDQLDRYYWWGEVLLRIQEQQDAELDEIVANALGTATPAVAAASAEPAAVEPAEEVVPAAHQGGNLFDLLNGTP